MASFASLAAALGPLTAAFFGAALSVVFSGSEDAGAESDAFSISAIADFLIGMRQFLLLPNSTMQSSSSTAITMP